MIWLTHTQISLTYLKHVYEILVSTYRPFWLYSQNGRYFAYKIFVCKYITPTSLLLQLTTDERLYLHAARLGEIALLRELVEEEETYSKLNVNCVDYMGRNALFLAVDTENVEAIEVS